MLNQSYFHTMKFNLGDYDLGDLGLGDFSLGDLGLGDFNLGDFDLIPTHLIFINPWLRVIYKLPAELVETEVVFDWAWQVDSSVCTHSRHLPSSCNRMRNMLSRVAGIVSGISRTMNNTKHNNNNKTVNKQTRWHLHSASIYTAVISALVQCINMDAF